MLLEIKAILLSVVTLHVTVQGQKSVTDRTENVHYDMVYIKHDGPVSRSKRSTEMPHTMFFNIKSHKTDVKLRLKRAPKLDIPTYMLKNGKVERVYIPDYQKHGVYISYDTGKAVMVSEKGGYYDVEGEVVVNNQNLQVTPLGEGRHNLFSAGPINYGQDFRTADKSNNLMPKISVRKAARKLRKGRRNRSRNRSKRQVTEYVIELLVVTDISVRNKFIARNGDLAIADAELKTYYALMILGMTERYQSISEFYPDVSYVVEGSGILIPATINDVPFYRDNQNNGLVQFDPALDDFTDWVIQNKGTLPKHDHAMWFTNDRLASGTSTSVIGVAWVNAICGNFGTSIVEDFYSGGTTATATHELGHSVGAFHDGDFRECSNNDFYVMAAFLFIPLGSQRSNPWFFSYCASVYIVYFTEQSYQCLSTDDNGLTSPSTSEVAGQYMVADEQCRLAFSSSSSYFCRNSQRTEVGFSSMCNRMYCYNPQSTDCEFIGSMDFTSCGDGQWCEKGDCVAATSAPQTASDCPQGDSPVASCNSAACTTYNTAQLTDCCETCSSPTSQTASPATSPTTSPATSPTTSPATSQTTSPTISPTTSPVTSQTTSPTISPTTSPATSQTTSPTISPTTSPATSQTTSPTISPTTSLATSQTTSPTISPTTSLVTSQTTSPTISPTTSPATSQTTSPTISPTTSPTNAPTTIQVACPALCIWCKGNPVRLTVLGFCSPFA